MNAPRVPFLNLRAQHDPMRDELLAAFAHALDTSAFAGGPLVEAFEREFAAYCGVTEAVGLGSGTEALWFALLAKGVGPGDEVITASATFMATAEAISYCGAKPVFIDIEAETNTMDPALIERAITPRTRAIIPVHLYGQMADMDPILELARRHGLFVLEDACQAHGASYKGRQAGSVGDAAAFSFYPGKNLGALGEAGALTTNDPEIAAAVRQLRDHGQTKKYHHAQIGWNGRMDGIQGAALSAKLRRLPAGNAARRQHAASYDAALAGIPGLTRPREAARGRSSWHLYVVQTPHRDALLAAMAERGVACALHYPVPTHLQPAYLNLGYEAGSLPLTERLAAECLSLPLYPELTLEQLSFTVAALRDCLERLPEPSAALTSS